MLEDRRHLVEVPADVDRMERGAEARHGQVRVNVAMIVEREGGDAISRLNAQLDQCGCQPLRAVRNLGPGDETLAIGRGRDQAVEW